MFAVLVEDLDIVKGLGGLQLGGALLPIMGLRPVEVVGEGFLTGGSLVRLNDVSIDTGRSGLIHFGKPGHRQDGACFSLQLDILANHLPLIYIPHQLHRLFAGMLLCTVQTIRTLNVSARYQRSGMSSTGSLFIYEQII